MPLSSLVRLPSIDLFSGIGGLTLGLNSVFRSIVYCELDPYCRDVLTARMRDGSLPCAPIHNDVTTLNLSDDCGARGLVAGFPCTDVSIMGLRQGLVDGQHSSLFFQIVRIVHAVPSIDVIFLENVDNLVRFGLREVLTELTKLGFVCRWTVVSASECGSPQVRKRLFLLATRNGFDASCWQDVQVSGDVMAHWTKPAPRQVSVRPEFGRDVTYDAENRNKRYTALCNVVVPQQAALAFAMLVRMEAVVMPSTMIKRRLSTTSAPLPTTGFVSGDGIWVPCDRPQPPPPSEHEFSATVVREGKRRRVTSLPTPVNVGRSARACADLKGHEMANISSHVVHSEETKRWVRTQIGRGVEPRKAVSLNIEFLEHVMGLPIGWSARVQKVICEASN